MLLWFNQIFTEKAYDSQWNINSQTSNHRHKSTNNRRLKIILIAICYIHLHVPFFYAVDIWLLLQFTHNIQVLYQTKAKVVRLACLQNK